MGSPYSKFSKEELILRDHLAIDRTVLANERTILAYARTALAVIAVGATLIHFFSETWIKLGGVLLFLFGLIILIIGLIKYNGMKKSINEIKRI